ncbi:MAG: YlbF family regulator [Eubacteriales bacterium]
MNSTENQEIITLARSLGEALKNSPEYIAFCETRDAMKKNMLLKEKLDEFKVQKSVLDIEKEKAQPDEHVVDVLSARLDVLYREITAVPEMKAYTKAEEDLNLLMTAVNMTISSYIGAEEYTSDAGETGEGSCTHDCSRCSGCH